MMRRRLISVLAPLACLSCGEASEEYILTVDTDAMVPDGTRTTPLEPMFDRVEFAVFASGASDPCTDCIRTFAIDEASFRRAGVSIGIPLSMAEARVRVRLFLAGNTGTPRPSSTIETVGVLPPVSEHTRLRVLLETATLAQPSGTLDAPISFERDDRAPSRVGTFGRDSFAECEVPSPEGTACIVGRYTWARRVEDPTFEMLTRISTFHVDLHEWSKTRFRAAGGRIDRLGDMTTVYSPNATCPETDGDEPATCVMASEAERLCRKAGGRLPTFQEFALLAGGLRGYLFPWGDDPPACEDAVVARTETGGRARLCSTIELGGYRSGPAPVGEAFGRDVVLVGDAAILGLAGNVSEWTQASLFGECSEDTPVADDPRCASLAAYAGGNFGNPVPAGSMRGVESVKGDPALPFAGGNPRLGFRCVYDVPPR